MIIIYYHYYNLLLINYNTVCEYRNQIRTQREKDYKCVFVLPPTVSCHYLYYLEINAQRIYFKGEYNQKINFCRNCAEMPRQKQTIHLHHKKKSLRGVMTKCEF